MAINIRGALSTLVANVKQGISGLTGDNGLLTIPAAKKADAGFQGMLGMVDDGTVVANGIRREVDVSADFRMRAGIDNLFWYDAFNYTTINISKYGVTTNVMTVTQANNLLNLNAGASVTNGQNAWLRTFRSFPIIPSAPVYLSFTAIGINQSAANAQADVGLYMTGSANGVVTDGVGFRWKTDGSLVGFMNNAGVETESPPLTQIADNVRGSYLIVVNDTTVEFWINGIFRAQLEAVATYGGSSVVASPSLPFAARLFNPATPSQAKRIGIGSLAIFCGDINMTRLWATTMTGMGGSSIQSPDGATASQLANYANSAAPTSATLSNTAAGYTALGGQFQFAAVAGAETDYALFAYTVPGGNVTNPGKSLIIRGIWIDTVNTGAAVATTETWLQWALGVGATQVSLAQGDLATSATRGPRRITLGNQVFPIGAAIGAQATRIDVNLDAPLVCESGSFVHVILKMPRGTATASQIIRGIVGINGYFE